MLVKKFIESFKKGELKFYFFHTKVAFIVFHYYINILLKYVRIKNIKKKRFKVPFIAKVTNKHTNIAITLKKTFLI